MSKYHSRKIARDGITFDSVKEYRRWCELSLLERAGAIQNLQRQVKYVLIPAQRAFTNEIDKKGNFKKGKLLERECAYIADFVYFDSQTGQITVEDTKGFKTKDYIIKRKLMLWVHGIRIQEI
jgi:hypothetical protein